MNKQVMISTIVFAAIAALPSSFGAPSSSGSSYGSGSCSCPGEMNSYSSGSPYPSGSAYSSGNNPYGKSKTSPVQTSKSSPSSKGKSSSSGYGPSGYGSSGYGSSGYGSQQMPNQSPSQTPYDGLSRVQALNYLHHVNTREIEASRGALTRLQDPKARAFAQGLIKDHQANEKRLSELASSTPEGARLYSFQPSTYDYAAEDQLRSVPEADFDEVFVRQQQLDHQRISQDLKLMQGELPAQDTQTRSLLDQTGREVERHRRQAAELEVDGVE